jgi:hypothetical protein
MAGMENYDMVEVFTGNRADQPLRVSILPKDSRALSALLEYLRPAIVGERQRRKRGRGHRIRYLFISR